MTENAAGPFSAMPERDLTSVVRDIRTLGHDRTVEGRAKRPSTAHLHRGEGNKPVTVRLDPDQLARAEHHAAAQGVTVVEVLRLGLVALDHLERLDQMTKERFG